MYITAGSQGTWWRAARGRWGFHLMTRERRGRGGRMMFMTHERKSIRWIGKTRWQQKKISSSKSTHMPDKHTANRSQAYHEHDVVICMWRLTDQNSSSVRTELSLPSHRAQTNEERYALESMSVVVLQASMHSCPLLVLAIQQAQMQLVMESNFRILLSEIKG